MSRLIGWVDVRLKKPMLLVHTLSGKTFSVTVDTGFNRELWMDKITAETLGVAMLSTHPRTSFVTAGNKPILTDVGELEIMWVLGPRKVFVHIHDEPGLSEVLLGTGLLHPGVLIVEFSNDMVKIDS